MGLAVSDVLRVHALTYASYKYERWGGFLLFGNNQFAVGCGLDALLAGDGVAAAKKARATAVLLQGIYPKISLPASTKFRNLR